MVDVVPLISGALPAIVVDEAERTQRSFLEFFAAQIRNHNTRAAYARAVGQFLAWARQGGLTRLDQVQPLHVAAWIEQRQRTHAPATVKQHLAAVRMLFDWLTARQVLKASPAAHVKGPRYSLRVGKTPVIEPDQVRSLLSSIGGSSVLGLRDRALIATMAYTFARVGAALALSGEDVMPRGRRLWLRLKEKGGRLHEMPCHHALEEHLMNYLQAAASWSQPKLPLFRASHRDRRSLSERPLLYANAHAMVRRRAFAAGLANVISCHSFRATGITSYLKNGGTIERAALMANHVSINTTRLYDRRGDELTLDEVERIRF